MPERRRLLALVLAALVATAPAARADSAQPLGAQLAARQQTEDPDGEDDPGDSGDPDGEDDPGGDDPGGDDPGGDDPGTEPVIPPPSPCPPNEIITATGDCVDPSVMAALLADFEAAAAEEAAALAELSAAVGDLEDLRTRLARLEDRVAAARERFTVAAEDAAYAALRQEVSAENLADVEAALVSEEERLREQAIAAYIGGDESDLGSTGAVLDAESLTAAGTLHVYAEVMVDDQLDTLARIDVLGRAVTALSARVDELTSAAAVTVGQLATLEDEVGGLLGQQRLLVSEAELQTRELAASIADIQARKDEFARELQLQAAGGGSIGLLLRQAQGGQTPPDQITGLFAPPIVPFSFGSGFGQRFHPIFHVWRMHTGLDVTAAAGIPIAAAAAGVVLVAGPQGGYGNVVVIDHGNGFGTLYAHMSATATQVGALVEAGDTIGFVGSTGFSTGPHLHFEVRIHGEPVDPVPYLDLTGDDPTAGDD